jgi:hypothetical protein
MWEWILLPLLVAIVVLSIVTARPKRKDPGEDEDPGD